MIALSPEVDAEIAEVPARPRLAASIPAQRAAPVLDDLRRRAAWFTSSERVADCRDFKDNKYLKLAAASNADTIVTGDSDLLVLHPWRGVHILRPADYLAEAG